MYKAVVWNFIICRTLVLFRALGLFALLYCVAWAQTSEPLEVKLEGYLVNVVTKDDGTKEETFIEATEARPGQVVEYRVIVTNIGNETIAASNALLTGPVPTTTTYIANTATASSAEARLEFSADGGATFAEKPMIEKENDQGEKELVEALPEDYTATRWAILIPLEPQQTHTFTYRVTVN
jgi:uncharacterized repeat protein (TIGR01451 family)